MEMVGANAAQIPAIGFGTYRLDSDVVRDAVRTALDTGYRLIDTAEMYGNDRQIAEAIAESGIPREEIFLTSKIWHSNLAPNDFKRSLDRMLNGLASDYLDLLLIHWPNPDIPLAETMAALDQAYKDGFARHVGVSNFPADLVRKALELCNAPLIANQVEYHPFLDQTVLRRELQSREMALIAYCPLARGRVQENGLLRRIGKRHGKTAAQIALRWLIQQERTVAIPGSADRDHIAANIDVFDFVLERDEMDDISALARKDGRIVDPTGYAPAWDPPAAG